MRMAHVTVHTSDLSGSVDFYTRTAGLRIIRDMRDRPSNRIVFVGDDEGTTLVELLEAEDASSVYTGSGISIGFETDDAEGLRERFEKEGLAPTKMRAVSETTKFFFLKDPNGLSVQFIEN